MLLLRLNAMFEAMPKRGIAQAAIGSSKRGLYDNSVFANASFKFFIFIEIQISLRTVVSMWKVARRLDETHM